MARRLGWTVLADSGALPYRLTALAALDRGIADEDETGVAEAARTLAVRFEGQHIYLDVAGKSATTSARNESAISPRGWRCGFRASAPGLAGSPARLPPRAPGLVADGRDMGTVVFPDAAPKIFPGRRCRGTMRKEGVSS